MKIKKQVLFIHGGGEGGYEADKTLVTSLQKELGKDYNIRYPELKSNESVSDFGWIQQIRKEVSKIKSHFFLVGHSLGASMILKYLSENPIDENIRAILLIATPFWSGNEDWKQGLKLKANFEEKLPKEIPTFFYHSKDDEEISFSHLDQYRQKIPTAIFREIKTGGHQFNGDISFISKDIKLL